LFIQRDRERRDTIGIAARLELAPREGAQNAEIQASLIASKKSCLPAQSLCAARSGAKNSMSGLRV
jgi:hypothetical protein